MDTSDRHRGRSGRDYAGFGAIGDHSAAQSDGSGSLIGRFPKLRSAIGSLALLNCRRKTQMARKIPQDVMTREDVALDRKIKGICRGC